MRKFTIQQAIETVAESLHTHGDLSRTTIRTAINDTLDAADKDGFEVDFDYDQEEAVDAVRERVSALRDEYFARKAQL